MKAIMDETAAWKGQACLDSYMQSNLELEFGKRKASLLNLVNILKVLFPLQYQVVLFSESQVSQS